MDQHEAEPVIHHETSPHYSILDDDTYFPVNHHQLRELLGKILTHLDAMGLPPAQHRATKGLLTQETWRWWETACDNAVTATGGCLAPVVLTDRSVPRGPGNRWGFASEAAYLAQTQPGFTPRRTATVEAEAPGGAR